jgi:hypothetical protein
MAPGHGLETELEEALDDWPATCFTLATALSPRTAEEAVLEGLRAGVAV